MYAIIQTGGKQYNVKEGDLIDVDLLHSENGANVEFTEVLLVSDGSQTHVGAPLVASHSVMGELIGEVKGEKLIGMKYKRRKQERKTFGHRQRYSRVKITDIVEAENKKKKR